jgi:integrase
MAVCGCPRGWPHYQVQAGPRDGRQTKTFSTLAAAKGWKRDVERAHASGERLPGRAPRVREAAEAWLAAAESGVALGRGDKRYKPSTLRGYRRCLEVEVFPEIGGTRMDEVTRGDLNKLVQRLASRGLAASTIRNIVIPLRALYRHAIDLEQITVNPTKGMRVPAGSGSRTRVAAVKEINGILRALDPQDRPLWATALYAGLRRGELMGLRWADIDLAAGVIRVEMNYDPGDKVMVEVKSEAGQGRKIPICAALREELLAHRQRAPGRPRGLVFARATLGGVCRRAARDRPFNDSAVVERAKRAWARAGSAPIGLHDCRHTFASLMIAAMAAAGNFNPKVLQMMLGHASITQTYDRYGHLFPGAEEEAGRMLDHYLEGAMRSEVAQASSRLLEVLERTTPDEAEPVVADLMGVLRAREEQLGMRPSVARGGSGGSGRAVSVPRTGPELGR